MLLEDGPSVPTAVADSAGKSANGSCPSARGK